MKKIIYTLLFAFSAGLFSSCDDFFETTNNTVYSGEDVFTDIGTAQMAVYGVYNMVSNAWSKRASMFFPVDDDCCVISITSSDSNQRKLARYQLARDNGELHNWHYAMMRGYVRGSMCIEQLENSPLMKNESTKKEAERLLGEALTMRAVMMLQIVNLWGDVPFDPRNPEVVLDFEIEKTDRNVILESLITDLERAVNLLPWRGDVTADERCTKGSALGYLARVCMFRAGYALRPGATRQDLGTMKRTDDYMVYVEKADKALETLVTSGKHHLNPSFYDHFKAMCEMQYDGTYGENLLEIAWAGGSGAVSGEVGYYMGPKASGTCKSGQCEGGIQLTPYYYMMFDQQYDTRFATTVAPYEIESDNTKEPTTLTTMYPGKIRRDWRVPLLPGTKKYTDMNWPLMRYSDALLLYAETQNEIHQKPTDAAIKAYEEVRKRAYKGHEDKIGTTPSTYKEFFEAIIKERALELASEGYRKYDLIRWNLLGSALQKVKDAALAIRDGIAPYDNIPDYMWFKFEEDRVLTSSADPNDASYTKVDWRKAIDDNYLATLAINNFDEGRDEVYPFHNTTLAANAKLANDFGY